jgi:hypothetical protein
VEQGRRVRKTVARSVTVTLREAGSSVADLPQHEARGVFYLESECSVTRR